MQVINNLYEIIKDRKEQKLEGSYTCYLFEKGLDKILKKVGEEASETIIAAKNNNNDELKNELCDLIYHMLVLAVQNGVDIKDIEDELNKRAEKIGNLKELKNTDKQT